MKLNKRKREITLKAVKDGKIKRLGGRAYSVPASFFLEGIPPAMVAEVDKERR